ncbi:MAG: HIT domain-containing protein [Anaerolineales bacterium]|nr:HIT domain-containing protein [Anaerolineales bacterium]
MFNLFLRLARTKLGHKLVGWIFAHMSFAIPARRLRETETLLAFHHPKPSYPFHVVLAPKKAVPNLMELDTSESVFLPDLFATVQSLVDEFQLPAYRLIVNGGEYQDFPHLHFHLVSDSLKTDN